MKVKHRAEVKAYKEWFKFSPFYLKNHPELTQTGDVADITHLSETHS